MTAFNVVRFRVKPGYDQEFLDAHKNVATDWPGLQRVNIIKTGEHSYCLIAEWPDMDVFAKARPMYHPIGQGSVERILKEAPKGS